MDERRRAVQRAWFWRTVAATAVVVGLLVFFFGLASDLDGYVFRHLEPAKEARAAVDVRAFTRAAHDFRSRTGAFPTSLAALAHPPDGPPLVGEDALISPWGQEYDYNPLGPRNHGAQPDIWIVTPTGVVIGNWVPQQ